MNYPFTETEKKWQQYWKDNKTFQVTEDPAIPREKRRYVLDMFPYPSAAGLHVGHPLGYTATDVYCRYLRMNGYQVLHPMGFDSFGLPAETYAIQTGQHPRKTTEKNIERFRKQIQSLGFSYDWNRELATHQEDYYKWTQWIFLQLYKKGLAYMAEIPVWYCEALGTVLANEEVLPTAEGPRSERGNHPVYRRPLRQWMLRITAYADRLVEGLDELDWPESIKAMQRNWIGRSTGAKIVFKTEAGDDIEVFTTRPDTLFGATYMVLAPEHPLVEALTTAEKQAAITEYCQTSALKSDLERTDLAREKTGVFTGSYALNPINGQSIPIWVSDYVLISYGSGAIMAVPAHDERDNEFAKKFQLSIVEVIAPDGAADGTADGSADDDVYTGVGRLINSGQFDGMQSTDAQTAIIKWLEERELGAATVMYKLRDWIFSRQRYWGEPIPVMHGEDGKLYTVEEDALPLLLPEVENYSPAGTGESPLALLQDWMNTTLPDGTAALRESNTMPQWAGSCWYYLRYLDPHNKTEFASQEKIDYWMPVDLYVGGAEHAVLHLLYARFWHKVLYDLGLVNTDEPFSRLVNQGMILGEDGEKMSKSLGNVVNPEEIVDAYGADAMRMYEMFIGPLRQDKPWSTHGVVGISRFLNRVWTLARGELSDAEPPVDSLRILHKTIHKVGNDINNLAFNTAISQLMICLNAMAQDAQQYRSLWEGFLHLIAPFAPHIAEELWNHLGHESPISMHAWPEYREEFLLDDSCEIVIQINGKVRAKIQMERDRAREEMEKDALEQEKIKEMLADKTIRKVIVVPNRLVNIVAE